MSPLNPVSASPYLAQRARAAGRRDGAPVPVAARQHVRVPRQQAGHVAACRSPKPTSNSVSLTFLLSTNELVDKLASRDHNRQLHIAHRHVCAREITSNKNYNPSRPGQMHIAFRWVRKPLEEFVLIKVRAVAIPLLIHHTAHRIKGVIREVTMGWLIKVRRCVVGRWRHRLCTACLLAPLPARGAQAVAPMNTRCTGGGANEHAVHRRWRQ